MSYRLFLFLFSGREYAGKFAVSLDCSNDCLLVWIQIWGLHLIQPISVHKLVIKITPQKISGPPGAGEQWDIVEIQCIQGHG